MLIATIAQLTSLHLTSMLSHIIRSYTFQKFYVLVAVKFCHLIGGSFVRSLKAEFHSTPVKIIVELKNVKNVLTKISIFLYKP